MGELSGILAYPAPTITGRSDSYGAVGLPDILMQSDMIAVVPLRLARHQIGLRIMEPPVEIPGFSKTLVWHERTHHDAGHEWIRSLLLETIKYLN